MEKSYQTIGYFFIVIWIITLVGFHKTYTVFFPTFTGFRWEHHFHGAVMMSWFALLIVQPFLIRYGQYEWHRRIGKLGYVVAPLACLSMLAMTRLEYPATQDVGGFQMLLDKTNIVTFGLFALLGFINKNRPAAHIRYMTATSFPIIGPGLGRALITYGGVSFVTGVATALIVSFLVGLVFLFLDVLNRKDPIPYLVICVGLGVDLPWWLFQT